MHQSKHRHNQQVLIGFSLSLNIFKYLLSTHHVNGHPMFLMCQEVCRETDSYIDTFKLTNTLTDGI